MAAPLGDGSRPDPRARDVAWRRCSRRRVAPVLARRGGESRAMSSRGHRGNRWCARFTVPQEPYCFYCNRRLLISGIKTDCFLLKGSLCTVILKVSNMKYRSRTIPYMQFHVHKNNLHDVLMVVPDLFGDGRRQPSGHDLADHRPGSGTAAETETTAPYFPAPADAHLLRASFTARPPGRRRERGVAWRTLRVTWCPALT